MQLLLLDSTKQGMKALSKLRDKLLAHLINLFSFHFESDTSINALFNKLTNGQINSASFIEYCLPSCLRIFVTTREVLPQSPR
jgi:hypothetical protein